MKIGILICSYNRYDYLVQCIESINRADIPEGTEILVVDDCSKGVHPYLNGIKHKFDVVIKSERRGICDSILMGSEMLFSLCDCVINLDGDAIVSNNFIEVLTDLKKRFPDNIITGFNCRTKNLNGSERHIVVGEGEGYNLKRSVGGINMMYDKEQYERWLRPALVRCLERGGNWDHQTCLASNADGYDIVCAVPSVVQHIGLVSSMGHTSTGEPADVADDFKPLQLRNVALIGIDDNLARLKKAADISCTNVLFHSVKLLSHENGTIRRLYSKEEYSRFVLKELINHIDTDYFILFQHDGFVINYKAWDNRFFCYDYIGGVWKFRDHNRVGNGGFSFRSRKLHEVLALDSSIKPTNDGLVNNFAEDHNIGYIYRRYLEKTHNIYYAPESICDKFSIEAWGSIDNKYKGSFGFHGYSVNFNDCDLPYIPYKYPNFTKEIL